MKGRVLVRPAADHDLDEQAQYLMEHHDRHSALRFLRAAQATFSLLSRHAKMGKVTAFDNKFLAGMRMFPIKGFPKHLVFYQPSHHGIEVLRIIHGARDRERIMAGLQ